MDGNFVFNAAKCNVDIEKQLGKLMYTQRITLFMTKAAVDELREVADSISAAKDALAFALRACLIIDVRQMKVD